MKLIFATHNQHKLLEIQQLLPLNLNLISLTDLNYCEEIEETGQNLEENALIKAQAIKNLYENSTFADDTGLEIEALDGQPGVKSARFAGEGKNSEDNMNKVLELMNGISNRKARFRTVIALIHENKEYLFEGIVDGTILEKPQGKAGFGYDPIFKPSQYDVSFAEMRSDEKNRISHRGKAVSKLIDFLQKI
jgi:XTP/dITP diphosphohydrolase